MPLVSPSKPSSRFKAYCASTASGVRRKTRTNPDSISKQPLQLLGPQVAGKLSVVLYGMLKNMTPYDQLEGNSVLPSPPFKQAQHPLTSPWIWSTSPNHRTILSPTIQASPAELQLGL